MGQNLDKIQNDKTQKIEKHTHTISCFKTIFIENKYEIPIMNLCVSLLVVMSINLLSAFKKSLYLEIVWKNVAKLHVKLLEHQCLYVSCTLFHLSLWNYNKTIKIILFIRCS